MNECPWVYDTRLMWQSLGIAMRGGIAWISGQKHWKVKIWLSEKTRTRYRGAQQFLFQSRLYRTNSFTCYALEVLHEKLAVMHKSWRTLAAYLHFCRFPLHHSHQSHFQEMKSSIACTENETVAVELSYQWSKDVCEDCNVIQIL